MKPDVAADMDVQPTLEKMYQQKSRGDAFDYLIEEGDSSEGEFDSPKVGSEIRESTGSSLQSMGREVPYDCLKFQAVLGQGAFGRVYKAMLWDTPVAVKELKHCSKKDTYMEIKKELAMLTTLRHPNCVLLLGYTAPPNASIICEYMDKGSLWDILHNPKERIDFKQILRVAKLVGRGLLYLHSNDPPIYHRDVKTQNVLVGGDNNGKWHSVKVCDFGLSTFRSKVTDDSKEKVGWCGSVQWRAPETEFEYTDKSDIFRYLHIISSS